MTPPNRCTCPLCTGNRCTCPLCTGNFQIQPWQKDFLDALNRARFPKDKLFGPSAAPRMSVQRVPGGLPASSSSTPWSDDLELAFDTEPIVGWRVWRAINITTFPPVPPAVSGASDAPPDFLDLGFPEVKPALRSAIVSDMWPWRERMEAVCAHEIHQGDAVPGHDCACGVWAMRDHVDLIRRGVMRPQFGDYLNGGNAPYWVIGKVALWGRVLEFEDGWRGRYAYPVNLTLLVGQQHANQGVMAFAQGLQDAYGVGVDIQPEWHYNIRPDQQALAFQRALDDLQKQIGVSLQPAVQNFAQGLVAASKATSKLHAQMTKDIQIAFDLQMKQMHSLSKATGFVPKRRPSFTTQLARNWSMVYAVLAVCWVFFNQLSAEVMGAVAVVMFVLWRIQARHDD